MPTEFSVPESITYAGLGLALAAETALLAYQVIGTTPTFANAQIAAEKKCITKLDEKKKLRACGDEAGAMEASKEQIYQGVKAVSLPILRFAAEAATFGLMCYTFNSMFSNDEAVNTEAVNITATSVNEWINFLSNENKG
jgi:hypothetical protein